MEKKLKKEVKRIIKQLKPFGLRYSVKKLINEINEGDFNKNWIYIYYGTCELSEDFIREFQDKLNWGNISYCQKLSENFIREFQHKVDWEYISLGQKISEDFVREFKYKIHWHNICRNYHLADELSEEFFKEFRDKLDLEVLFEKKVVDEFGAFVKVKDRKPTVYEGYMYVD